MIHIRTRTALEVYTIVNQTQTSSLLTAALAGYLLLDLTKLRNNNDPSFKLFLHCHVQASAGTAGEIQLMANGTAVGVAAFTNTTAGPARWDLTAACAGLTGVQLFQVALRRSSGVLGSVTMNAAQIELEMDVPDA